MSFLDRINEVTPCDPSHFIPFYVNRVMIGMMKPEFAQILSNFPSVFQTNCNEVSLSPNLDSYKDRTNAIATVLGQLRKQGLIPGWRDELYPISLGFNSPSLFDMERAATGLFGVQSYAISVNGFVRLGDDYYIWIGRRSATKETYPGELDIMVGGGHPAGISLRENLIKECCEEAGLPETIAKTALPVGGISFCSEQCGEIINQFQFVYDLELSTKIIPNNVDGEVESFELLSTTKIMEILYETDEFMFDSALVIIDFLIRHGHINPEHPEYTTLVLGLRH